MCYSPSMKIIKKLLELYYLKLITSIILIFGAGILFIKLFGPLPFILNETVTQKGRTFDVSAEGKVMAVPDTAKIDLGVNISKSTVAEAQKDASEKMTKIDSSLKALGIDDKDIKTSAYSVYPNYDYKLRRNIGYQVYIMLSVKVKDFEKINSVIDTTTAQGANQIGALQFVIDDDRYEELKSEARKQAIDKAKKKAQTIAGDAGINLGKLVNVVENDRQSYYPYPAAPVMKMAEGAQDNAQSTFNIQPGESEIKAEITLSYETY